MLRGRHIGPLFGIKKNVVCTLLFGWEGGGDWKKYGLYTCENVDDYEELHYIYRKGVIIVEHRILLEKYNTRIYLN